jgi:acyl-CoA thioester hydrolase
MAEQGFSQTYRVKWADLDPNGHVRHSAYDDYAVDTRVRWMEQSGFPPRRFAELGFGPVILRQESRFYREVTIDDTLTVTIQLTGLSPDGSRWKVQHDILKANGEKAAALEIEGSWLDLHTRKAMAPPADLLRLFTQAQKPGGLQELRSLVRKR